MKGLQSRHRKALQDGAGIPEVSPAPSREQVPTPGERGPGTSPAAWLHLR